MMFEVTPEVKARIEKCASRANMSVSEAGGVLLEFELNKQEALEEIIRGKVQTVIDVSLDQLESIIEPLLSPPRPGKGKKGFSN